VDEIFLATSLVKMNFMELTSPSLDYEQKAPIGFLWMCRLAVLAFGKGEMALRLFPLLCGFGTLFLFVPVARYFLKPLGVVVAVGIMAAAPPIVYHAVEAKQYSTELFASVLIMLSYIKFHRKMNMRSLLLWGFLGAAILWFSFSSIFILAGLAFGVCLSYMLRKEWSALFRSIIPFSMWLVSFAVNFFLFTYQHTDSEWLLYWFRIRDSFMPFPPSSVTDLKWFFKKTFSILHYPLGLSWVEVSHSYNEVLRVLARMSLLPLLLLGAGLVAFYRKDKREFAIIVFPVLLTLLASGLTLYPFMDRLLVFLAPLLILAVALGCERIVNYFPNSAKWRYILPVLLLAGPIANSMYQVVNTGRFGDYKKSYQVETLTYINDRYQEGDVVYIYWNDLVGYRYYKTVDGYKYEAVQGKDYRYVAADKADYYRRLAADVDALRTSKRVWLVYSNRVWSNIGDFDGRPAWYYAEDNTRKMLHDKFSALGTEVDTYLTDEVNVHLFEVRK